MKITWNTHFNVMYSIVDGDQKNELNYNFDTTVDCSPAPHKTLIKSGGQLKSKKKKLSKLTSVSAIIVALCAHLRYL